MKPRGWFGVGVYHPKHECNIGTLWRSALAFGADFLFTIGRRYRRQASDTPNVSGIVPLFHFDSFDTFRVSAPSAILIGVELTPTARELGDMTHPERCVYLLGAEDHGLPAAVLARCQTTIKVEMPASINVASIGTLVMWHRSEQVRKRVPGAKRQCRFNSTELATLA